MKRIAFVVLYAITLTFAVASLDGCGASAKTTTATLVRDATVSSNATAHTIETTQSLCLVMYRTEQELQIQIALQNGEGKAQAQARVVVVRNAWLPIWDALTKARVAHKNLVSLLSAANPDQDVVQAAINNEEEKMTAVMNQVSIARSRIQKAVP